MIVQEELVKVKEKEPKVVETAAVGHDSEDPWSLNLPPLGVKPVKSSIIIYQSSPV